MVDIIVLIAGVIFLIPFTIQLRLYYFTKSNSYLRFCILFFLVFVDSIITAFEFKAFYFQIAISFSFTLTLVILVTISMEFLDQKFPINRVQWWIFGFLIFLGTIIMKYLIENKTLPSYYSSLRVIYGQIFEFITGFMIIYSVKKVNFIKETIRTNQIRNLWLIVGFLLIYNSISTILIETIIFLSIEKSLILTNTSLTLINTVDTIASINLLIISLLTLVFAVFYPETLLLSIDQFEKASYLYRLLEETDIENNFYSEEIVLEYLKSLPKNLSERKDLDSDL